jgi:hypothetical protein
VTKKRSRKEKLAIGAVAIAVVALVVVALFGIGAAAGGLYALAAVPVLVCILWPRWGKLPRIDLYAGHLAAAALLGLLAVVGFNILVSQAQKLFGGSGEWRLPILLGMGVAGLVFAAVAWGYLRWRDWGRKAASWAGLVLALLTIGGLPIAFGLAQDKRSEVPTQALVASQVDLLIVGDGSTHELPLHLPPLSTLAQFDVRYSVGVATGEGVRWTLVDEPSSDAAVDALAAGRGLPAAPHAPVPRTGADPVLLLAVDGTPPASLDPAALPQVRARRGEVAEWKRVAAAAAPPGTPVFALLQSTNGRRLDEWRRWRRLEGVASAQEQGQAIPETALQLAVGSATAQADFALAMAHRPILRFDRDEPYPLPVSVDSLFLEGRITLCDDRGVSTTCGEKALRSPHGLLNGDTHLRLDLRPREAPPRPPGLPPGLPDAPPTPPPGLGSTIYVHPVSVDRGRKHLLYLDYWWYLPGNPVDVGGGALCGAGLVIPGITCQSHESDWEGLTVVVDRSPREPRVLAVHYAQHNSVVRYSWRSLRERWQEPDVAGILESAGDAAGRPLAFVARGTHATYPEPCGGGCRQVGGGTGESAHDGDLGWTGNDTVECTVSACLLPLPTQGNGEKPALWNAYTGQWGERHCRFTYYCDSGSPPTAPGNQGRYEDPIQYDDEAAPLPMRR